MHTIIIANGEPPSNKLLKTEANSNATIICADGGANTLTNLEIIPNYIIGDLDSIQPTALQFFQNQNVTIEKHPCEKDTTDLELAFTKAVQLGSESITLLGATGKRFDHTLANLGILLKAAQHNIPAIIKDDTQSLQLLTTATTLYNRPKTTFSLQAYTSTVENLSIKGSKYELQNYTLKPGDGRTISNEFLEKPVIIDFSSGKLLLIQQNAK